MAEEEQDCAWRGSFTRLGAETLNPKPSPTIGLTVACLRNPKADKAIKNPAIENVDETT